MFIEICLAILTAAVVALVFVLLRISYQTQQSILLLQKDIQALSKETIFLLNTLNQFVRNDLHTVISNVNELSSDINNKSQSLNFLFKSVSSLNSKLNGDSPPSESSSNKCETIPQILKWIASSVFLFKTTKEFIKNYEKRT